MIIAALYDLRSSCYYSYYCHCVTSSISIRPGSARKSDRKDDRSGKSTASSALYVVLHKSRYNILRTYYTRMGMCNSFIFWELSYDIECICNQCTVWWSRETDVRNLDLVMGHGLRTSEGQDRLPRVHYFYADSYGGSGGDNVIITLLYILYTYI